MNSKPYTLSPDPTRARSTPLMSSASDALGAALAGVEVNEPRIPMYSNVTGEPFTAQGARELLQRQLCVRTLNPYYNANSNPYTLICWLQRYPRP